LQHTLRQLARHRRKLIQKLRQRLTRFDVFKQNPHQHARARKHRRAAQNVGIDSDEGRIQHAPTIRLAAKSTNSPGSQRKDWQGTERGKCYQHIQQQLTVRGDADVLEWLKSQDSGYPSRLNAILLKRHAGCAALG
jgi:uncharacterized protein (DUF4415 family)